MEENYYALQQFSTNFELIIKFPDPEIHEDLVRSFSSKIDEVHFPTLMAPRECVVKLKENANIEKTIKEISKIRFGAGKLNVKRKLTNEQKLKDSNVEEVDPFTIFFGNIPNSKISKLKMILQAKDVDIQIGQNKRKPKSYAFAKFKSFEDAAHGFKKCTEKFAPSQFITIRFKRKVKQTDDDLPPQFLQNSTHNKTDLPVVFPIEQIPSEPVETEFNYANNRSSDNTLRSGETHEERVDKPQSHKLNSPAVLSNEQEESNLTISTVEQVSNSNDNRETKSRKYYSITTRQASHNKQSVEEEGFDPNKEIKLEPGTEKYLGFQKNLYDDEDMDGDTDCSGSTYRCSNSIDSERTAKRRRSHSSNDSVLALTDTDDETGPPSSMKKPKLLVLPMILHGSMRDVKDEKNESSDDEIGDIGDLDLTSY